MFFQVLNIEKKLNFKLVLTSKKYPATLLLHDYIFCNAQCKLRLSYAETFPGKSKFNYIKGQRLALFKNQCWCWGQRSSSLWWFVHWLFHTNRDNRWSRGQRDCERMMKPLVFVCRCTYRTAWDGGNAGWSGRLSRSWCSSLLTTHPSPGSRTTCITGATSWRGPS